MEGTEQGRLFLQFLILSLSIVEHGESEAGTES